jgi:hypothetical protein
MNLQHVLNEFAWLCVGVFVWDVDE